LPVHPPQSGPLHTLLPIRLKGGFVIEHLADDCSQCRAEIPMELWTSDFSWLGPASVVVQMHANCPSCGARKDIHARFRGKPDGTAEVDSSPGNGKAWEAYEAFAPSFWGRMIWSVRQVFGLRN